MSANDWIEAALHALLTEGPAAVAVQPIARTLGTSKGSFYWYFATRDDLLRAALERWHRTHTEDVIAAVERASDDPGERLRYLFALVTESSRTHPGQLRLLTQVDHPAVRQAIERATTRRIDCVAQLLRATGIPRGVAADRARVAYAAYLGHAQLAYATPDVLPRSPGGRRRLLAEMSRILLDDPR
jgi:AcrR family transcriptional regulator